MCTRKEVCWRKPVWAIKKASGGIPEMPGRWPHPTWQEKGGGEGGMQRHAMSGEEVGEDPRRQVPKGSLHPTAWTVSPAGAPESKRTSTSTLTQPQCGTELFVCADHKPAQNANGTKLQKAREDVDYNHKQTAIVIFSCIPFVTQWPYPKWL